MKKYKLTKETIEVNGHILHRIKALKNFGGVTKGNVGGFIEKEENLSQLDKCWVYDNAKVFGNAIIRDNARVYNNAEVFDSAKVFGNAEIFTNSLIYECASISDFARVSGEAKVFDFARVSGKVKIYGNARIFGRARTFENAEIKEFARVYEDAEISGDAIIKDNAKIYGCADVHGDSVVYGNGIVAEKMCISNSCVKEDLTKNLVASIVAQTGLAVMNNKVIAYKQVNEDLSSFYDKNFIYPSQGIIEAKKIDESKKSCAAGLHFSNANYWLKNIMSKKSYKTLVAEIDINDIITVQDGKIRCRKANILGIADY